MSSLFLKKLLIRTGLAGLLPHVRRLSRGGSAYLHYYNNRLLAAPHAELTAAAAFLEAPPGDAIDLAQGAPRFDLLPSVSTKLPADRRGYPPPWGLPELRQAVADSLAADQQLHVPAEQVLVTHGAAGAFSTALDTFVNPGDAVVLFDPTSLLYPFLLRQRRAGIRWVPTWVEKGRLRFRLDHFARAMHRARLAVVACPSNPTGAVFAGEDLEQIAWWAGRQDVLLFSDKSFARYQYEGEPLSLGTLAAAQNRTLTAGSVSKGHALAALRVGWLAGQRHLVSACALTQTLQTPFVPTLCQQLAAAALQQDRQTFAPLLDEFASRRLYVFERLQALGLYPAWPSGAFFFWVPVWPLGLDGRTFAQELLRTNRVLVWPGEWFGPSGAAYVRVSYAADEGRLREGLNRLDDFVQQLQGARPTQVAARAA